MYDRVIGDPHADGALFDMREPSGDVFGGGQNECVRPGGGGLDRPEHGIAEMHEVAQLPEVGADQGEVVVIVEIAQSLDSGDPVGAADSGAEGVAGVSRIGDEGVVGEHGRNLRDCPWLRVHRMNVEVPGHIRSVVGCVVAHDM